MNPNKPMNGYVAIVLTDYSKSNLLKEAGHAVLLGKEVILAFAPVEPIFDTNFKALIGQEVVLEVMTTVADERGKIAMVRLPVEIPSFQTPFIAISTAEGVSPDSLEDLVKRGLKYPIESDDVPILTLGGFVTFVPFMSTWASEINARAAKTTESATDDSFFEDDRAPSPERKLEGAPELASRKGQPRIVASHGPTASAPSFQVIGARRHYKATAADVPFNLTGWDCTDRGGKPTLKGSWMVKVVKAKGEGFTAPAEIPVANFKASSEVTSIDSFADPTNVLTSVARRVKGGGVEVKQTTRQIVIPMKVGQRFQGRYRMRDGSMSFQAVQLKFRPGTPSKTERWDGPTNGYSEFYQSVTAGGVKLNLIGSAKEDLDGVYRLEIKAKVINHVHDTDPTASKAVVTYMVSAYRLAAGTKPTKRLYLESAGRATPEGATVITTTGQCLIVLIDPNRPQITPSDSSAAK